MNDQEHSKEKPSFEEIVAGKDVALGKEIVESLMSEDIGVSIYNESLSKSKTKVSIDRKPGEDDYQVRESREAPRILVGFAVPTENEGEFIYFGIEEQGLVFNTKRESIRTEFNPEINRTHSIFRDRLIESFSEIYPEYVNITLKEDDSPEEFNKVFVASIERERDKVKRKKASRSESRKNLKQGLFGKKD